MPGHIAYTKLISNQGELPPPNREWQTWHPPLYYLIAQFFAPHHPQHVFWVRVFSIFLGCFAIILLAGCLRMIQAATPFIFLTLAIVATTPSFLFVFTSYSNDPLSIMLCMAAVFGTMKCIFEKPPKNFNFWLVFLFISITAGLYSKYTSFSVGIILFGVTATMAILKKLDWERAAPILLALALAVAVFWPWLFFHNYFFTNSFFPTNWQLAERFLPLVKYKNVFIPHWGVPMEWYDPFAGTKTDYFAYFFSSSLFDIYHPHWDFTFSLPAWTVWAIFWTRLIIQVSSVALCFKNKYSRMAAAIILLASLIQLFFLYKHPIVLHMSFRYVAWTWLPWTILFFNLLQETAKMKSVFLRISGPAIFSIAVGFQTALLFSFN